MAKKKTVKKPEAAKKVVKKLSEMTVRQFFYINKKFEESLIKTLERTHHETVRTEEEWREIMKKKKIDF